MIGILLPIGIIGALGAIYGIALIINSKNK